MPQDAERLLPCPFCGSPAGWWREGNHFVVGCGTCNGQVSRLDKADAISNWNRRSSIESKERWFDGGVDLNAHQLRQALDFLGGDEESEVTIKRLTTAQAEEGGGVYVWCSEYPEEGSMKLVPREDKEPTAPDLTL